MPFRPDRFARRGTRFHAWVENRFGATHLLDLDDLPGSAEEDEEDFTELTEAFERSEWALRTPVEVEVPFEVRVGEHLVRGRMDAVFADGDGWVVVDWKTGSPPGQARMPAVALQLAVYRLAWARLIAARRGEPVDVENVRAVFHYVRSGRTVEPADLPGPDRLRELLDSTGS